MEDNFKSYVFKLKELVSILEKQDLESGVADSLYNILKSGFNLSLNNLITISGSLNTYEKTYGRNDENGNLILPADDEDKDDDWSKDDR